MSSFVPIKLAYNTHEPENEALDCTLSPVVFFHGFAASKETWKDLPQTVANETKRKVYNIDLRNHGDSDWTDDFDNELLKRDIVHFMDSVAGCKTAIFISHSMGARIAIQLALEEPDRVSGLIVEEMMVGKVSDNVLGFPRLFLSVAPKYLPSVPQDATEEAAIKFLVDNVCSTHSEKVKQYILLEMDKTNVGLRKTTAGRYAFKANVEVLARAVRNSDRFMVKLKGRYDGPALFIYGTSSPYDIASEINNIKEYFSKAEFHGMDTARHNLHHDKPKEFQDAVLKFLFKQLS